MALIVTILAAITAIIFALSRLLSAASEGREAVRDVENAVRRGRWSKKADGRLVDTLEDPRDAAAILLVQTAAYKGEISAAQKSTITGLMQKTFDIGGEEAEGLYSFGRMAIGQLNDAGNSTRRILRPILDTLTLEEMRGFVAMLDEVAEVDGDPVEAQRLLISEVRRSLALTSR